MELGDKMGTDKSGSRLADRQVVWKIASYKDLDKDELYEILRVRAQVFCVEQACAYNDLDGLDALASHLMGWAGTELVAYARLFAVGTRFPDQTCIGRVLSAKSFRGTGLGRECFRRALEWAVSVNPNFPVRIFAQAYLVEFYKSFGFNVVSERELEDGIPHYWMVRANG